MEQASQFVRFLESVALQSERLSGFQHYLASFGVLLVLGAIVFRIKYYRLIIIGIWQEIDWWWVMWEGGLPLALPVVMAVLIKAIEWSGPSPDNLDMSTVLAETTPWTLIFFALTLNAHSIRKLWPYLDKFKPSFAAILAITLLVALYAAFLIEWRSRAGWIPSSRCYTVASVLTILSILFCSRISHISPHMGRLTDPVLPGSAQIDPASTSNGEFFEGAVNA